MKKRLLIVLYIVLSIITAKLIMNIALNIIFINKYNSGEYSENESKLLTIINFPEAYIAEYNYGNILYKNKEYKRATEKYKKALNTYVPRNKECNIRINYALSICNMVDLYESTVEDKIKMYESAIEILVEDGCANREDSNGHSEQAEKLKKDIQDEIDRLKNQFPQEQQGNSEEKENRNEEDDNSEEESGYLNELKQEIQDIMEESTGEQKDIEYTYKHMENIIKDTDIKGKNW